MYNSLYHVSAGPSGVWHDTEAPRARRLAQHEEVSLSSSMLFGNPLSSLRSSLSHYIKLVPNIRVSGDIINPEPRPNRSSRRTAICAMYHRGELVNVHNSYAVSYQWATPLLANSQHTSEYEPGLSSVNIRFHLILSYDLSNWEIRWHFVSNQAYSEYYIILKSSLFTEKSKQRNTECI